MSDKVHIALVTNGRYRSGLECMKASMVRTCAESGRLAFHVFLSWTLGPLLDLADKLPGGYAWKMAIMRLRRQLAWARFTLGFRPASC